jgi:opacity protein-like surface antigen
MKKFLGLTLFAFLFVFSLNANAQNFYVRGNAGVSMLMDNDYTQDGFTIEFDKGIALGVATGYDFGKFRIEGEIEYQKNDVDKYKSSTANIDMKGDVSSTIFFANGYYDFHNNSKFTPFVTAGLGVGRFKTKDWSTVVDKIFINFDDESYTEFIYNIGCGMEYAINEKVSIETKYRYLDVPNFESYANHNLLLGVRYNF